MKTLHLKMFECCIPVKGASRSIVCDIQRASYQHVPNSMYEFIQAYDGVAVETIKADFTADEATVVDEYINFLIENEFAFLTKNPEYFPGMSKDFDLPCIISNAIIDNDRQSDHDYQSIFSQLDALGCQSLEIRFFDCVGFNQLLHILTLTAGMSFRSVELLLKADTHTLAELPEYALLLDTYKQLSIITIHSLQTVPDQVSYEGLILTPQQITGESCCGNINPLNFSCNIHLFTESQAFNNCLHRKISIDKRGLIKNCPSMAHNFGSVREVKLADIISLDHFHQYWKISKDHISICKDCEYRYICTDCRAYTVEAGNIYSKPLKCTYDPYSGVWDN